MSPDTGPDQGDEPSDKDNLLRAAELLDGVDAGGLPNPHDERVRRWRDQLRSAATAAAGGGTDPVTVDDALEQGVCPWCDDYEGDGVAQHASSAHPDRWAEHRGTD